MSAGDKPVIGTSGIKYGLQLPKAPPKQPPKVAAVKALFSIDDENEEEIKDIRKVMLEAQRAQSARMAQVEEEMKHALAEDPTAFEYDSIYDHMKGPSRSGRAEPQRNSTPKYIGNLLAKAEERKRQADLVYEKKLQRELEAEKELFGETEAFITPAYKEKLEENRRFEEEQRRKEEEDEKRQAAGKKDMSSFYSNLMTKNVAFGAQGGASSAALEAPSSRSDAPDQLSRHRTRSRSPRRESRRNYSGDSDFERQRDEHDDKLAEDEENAKKRAESEAKKYAKRNVGQRFDDARERYFQRVAARKAGAPVPAK
eukprot:TRINITY_DN3134_c0_g1_i1.p1 TRINITY_DN3134_c0_g1~~TRINITY_DN3134_c0_g1_i1.p1  ORF type:complete len:313 (-),score=87.49 TRINITY_DN3134_c0_g1_i1:324-1262(-)